MTASHGTLLVVDDDAVFRERLGRALGERGFKVHTAGDVASARTFPMETLDYAVVDLRMPGESGLEFIKALAQQSPHTQAVVLTGYGSIPTAIEATRLGAVAYLAKPVDADDVFRALTGEEGAELDGDMTPSLARAEWEYIHRVWADVGQNVSEAARRLGIPRRTLQRKLQKHPPLK